MVKVSVQKFKIKFLKDADMARYSPALVKVENRLIVIGGAEAVSLSFRLPYVSSYNLTSDVWVNNLSPLNRARMNAAACYLTGNVYVFAGADGGSPLNSIEKIVASNLLSNNQDASWQLIEVPQSIAIFRYSSAVAPLNDTEIAILGGCALEKNSSVFTYFGDVMIFDTRSEQC